MNPAILRQTDSVTGAEKTGISPEQFRWKNAAEHRLCWPVEISQQSIQQPRALNQSFTHNFPLMGRDQQRDKIHAPGPVHSVRVAVDIVRYAVLVNEFSSQVPPLPELFGFQGIQNGNEFLPVRPQGAVRLHHFRSEEHTSELQLRQ